VGANGAGRRAIAGLILALILVWTSVRLAAAQLQSSANEAFWGGRLDEALTRVLWWERFDPSQLAAEDREMEIRLEAMDSSAGAPGTPAPAFRRSAEQAGEVVRRLVDEAPLRPETWASVGEFYGTLKIENQRRRVYSLERLSTLPEENLEPEDLLQVRALERATRVDPNGVYYHDSLGNLCWNMGLRPLAVRAYEEAVILSPDASQHPFLGSMGLPPLLEETAVRAMERALAPPRNAAPELVYRNLGYFLLSVGRYAEARQAFEKAESSSASGNYVSYQAAAAAQEGKDELAIELYRRSLGKDRLGDDERLRIRMSLGELLEKLGKHEEAAAQLRGALALEPRNAQALLLLARVYEAMDRLDEAEEQYSRAASSSRERITPLVNLIEFYRRHGRPAEALVPAWKLVELEPDERAYRDLVHQLQSEIEQKAR
jgi:tetratricopeptide (TPR) repeat protein